MESRKQESFFISPKKNIQQFTMSSFSDTTAENSSQPLSSPASPLHPTTSSSSLMPTTSATAVAVEELRNTEMLLHRHDTDASASTQASDSSHETSRASVSVFLKIITGDDVISSLLAVVLTALMEFNQHYSHYCFYRLSSMPSLCFPRTFLGA